MQQLVEGLVARQQLQPGVGPDDDVALTGLSTASLNEFAEVVLGGTIAITAAVPRSGCRNTSAMGAATSTTGTTRLDRRPAFSESRAWK